MRAGTLRHSVTILRPALALGTRGQQNGGDEAIAGNVACSVETLSGDEAIQARQIFASATLRVRMRGNPALKLTTKDKLRFKERILNIGSINNVKEVGREYVLLCGEER